MKIDVLGGDLNLMSCCLAASLIRILPSQVYFGTQHARVYLVAQVLDQNCATGMSAVVRKSALVAEGGLEAFSEYLAEDFFISKALWERLVM